MSLTGLVADLRGRVEMSFRTLYRLMIVAIAGSLVVTTHREASAWDRLLSFERFADGHLVPANTTIGADRYPNSLSYFVDNIETPAMSPASVVHVGGTQGKVLSLGEGERFSFNPSLGILMLAARVEVAPLNAQSGFLALDTHLYPLADVLATATGVLEAGQSRWNYKVTARDSGYAFLALERAEFMGVEYPQFAIIGGASSVFIDNVDVHLFPEPSSLAIATSSALMLAALRRAVRRSSRA
jgi:hypothetical protein